MKRIYLIDCPGVVPPNQNDSEEDILLRGVVRVENVHNPEQYIPGVLKKVLPRHIERTYEIKDFDGDAIEFLSILARKGGRLLRGGEPDLDGVAKMVINDFLRGKIPWFTPPPYTEGNEDEKIEGREGRLGEMSKKRKRDTPAADSEANDDAKSEDEEDDSNEFEEFDDDDESDGGIHVSDDDDDDEDEDEDKDGDASAKIEVKLSSLLS